MATRARKSGVSDRFVFQWSLLGIVCCLLMVGLSSLAWLREDLNQGAKITLELLCSAFLALDLYFHKGDLATLLRRQALRVVTVQSRFSMGSGTSPTCPTVNASVRWRS